MINKSFPIETKVKIISTAPANKTHLGKEGQIFHIWRSQQTGGLYYTVNLNENNNSLLCCHNELEVLKFPTKKRRLAMKFIKWKDKLFA